MQKILNIIYYILILVLSQFIIKLVLSYFIKNYTTLDIVSFIVALIIVIIFGIKNKQKANKNKLSKIEYKKYLTLVNLLKYSSKKESLKIIRNFIDPNLKLNNTNSYLINSDKSSIYILKLTDDHIQNNDVVDCIQQYSDKYKTLNIYCLNIGDTIDYKSIEQLTININLVTILSLIESKSIILEKIIPNTPKQPKQKIKTHIKRFLSNLVTPQKWKNYLMYGLTLLAISRFSKDKIYLTIFAGIFITLTILCLFIKLNKNHTNETL